MESPRAKDRKEGTEAEQEILAKMTVGTFSIDCGIT